ncbi:hypothetical protein [Faecalibaculum rodentium]|uniref:hypothetical protein n=2 Tax=Faecalibaculum rodentium TaxID=1702221 RepID=UPI00258F16A8|nr:hypothetical protein [Faecalibaculum rodentium]
MGQATGSQKARPEVMDVKKGIMHLLTEIRQLEHELDEAKSSGNDAEVKRIRKKLEVLRDSLKKWSHLLQLFQDQWGGEG